MARRSAVKEDWGARGLVVGCLLLAGTVGCGSSVDDTPANAERRVGNGPVEVRAGTGQPPDEKPRQADPAPTTVVSSASATVPLTAIPRDDDDRLNIPDTVAKDLGSPDPRDRHRALDYWEKKDGQAPLDPVYDAMEDDDPAVRAKAAAIIQQSIEVGEESQRD